MLGIGPLEKLGTIWWFEFFDVNKQEDSSVEQDIVAIIDEFEDNYSRFKQSSLISQLNTRGVVTNPPQELADMLDVAVRAYRETRGVFNIAVGGYLENIGYNQTYSFEKKDESPVPDLDQVLVYNQNEIRISPGTKLDVGGFGKGYLIDKIAHFLQHTRTIEHFLINGGGDMYASSNGGEPITIGLQDPQTLHTVGTTTLVHQGFASSSPHLRAWTDQYGDNHDHLVSMNNIEKKSTYVVAPSATEADIWATALSLDHTQTPPDDIQVSML